MRIQIVAVGKLKAGPEQALYDRYAERFSQSGRKIGLNGPSLVEIPESRQNEANARKADEAARLLAKVEPGSAIICLDEHGRDTTSQQFCDCVAGYQDGGMRTLVFAIGGADGHGQELLAKAALKLRFGAMTWPHQLVRLLLVEQLYRTNTIRLGHPYHRE